MPGYSQSDLLQRQQQAHASEQSLDQFNQQLRANPAYQQFLRSLGVNPSGPMTLTEDQRKRAEQWVRQHVGDIGDLEIDPAGNANQNEGLGKQLRTYGIPAAGMATALFGIPGVVGGALNSSASAAAPALGNVNATLDALQGAASAAPALASTGAAAAAKGALDKFTDPKSLAALAGLGLGGVSALTGGVNGPVDDDAIQSEIAQSLALQRSRVEQAQPAYDTLVRMAYGMSPTAYRGAAPQGYTAPETNNPAYAYQAPRFGR